MAGGNGGSSSTMMAVLHPAGERTGQEHKSEQLLPIYTASVLDQQPWAWDKLNI